MRLEWIIMIPKHFVCSFFAQWPPVLTARLVFILWSGQFLFSAGVRGGGYQCSDWIAQVCPGPPRHSPERSVLLLVWVNFKFNLHWAMGAVELWQEQSCVAPMDSWYKQSFWVLVNVCWNFDLGQSCSYSVLVSFCLNQVVWYRWTLTHLAWDHSLGNPLQREVTVSNDPSIQL